RRGQVVLGSFGAGSLGRIQQAIGEAVSALQVGLSGELAQYRSQHGGVLMVAEEALEGLEAFAQPRGRLTQPGCGGLGGIAQPFGRLASLMQGTVTVLAGWLALRLGHPRLDPAVSPANAFRQLALGFAAGPCG